MDFLEILSAYAYNVPHYMILLGGIVYAIVNRQKHPRTSLFAGIALGILLVGSLLSTVGFIYIQYQSTVTDLPATEFGIWLSILSGCTLLLSILGWILLLMAMFRRENVIERETVDDHKD